MTEETGTVRYTGQNPVSCGEAEEYTVKDADGKELDFGTGRLLNGYTIGGIPEGELVRWVLNQKFEPVDSAAKDAARGLRYDVAKRINGTLIDQEAAVEEIKRREKQEAALGTKSKKDLVDIAEEEGVEIAGNASKVEIVEAIEKARYGDPTQTESGPPQPPPAEGTITTQEGEGS